MNIAFTPEQEARLAEIAAAQHMEVADVIVDSVQARFDSERYWDGKLRRSLEQMNRGELIEEEEMDRRLAEMLKG